MYFLVDKGLVHVCAMCMSLTMDAPDTDLAGYPANLKGRLPDIDPASRWIFEPEPAAYILNFIKLRTTVENFALGSAKR
jgi:hypothetical protein